jgi:hypothetical protein
MSVIVRTVDDLTDAWLSDVLGVTVSAFATAPVGTGQMGDSFRVTVAHDGVVPTSFVLKVAAANETSRATGLALRIFEVEVRYYLELARRLDAPVPRCWFGAVDVETGWFSLLLEDLAPAVQGDQLIGCNPEQAELALVELAALHASGWERADLAALSWLNRSSPESTQFTASLIAGLFPGFLERYVEQLPSRQVEICTALMGSLPTYLGDAGGPLTVVHGDYRLDNLMFDGTRAVTVLDWQTATWGPPAVDVSYFLACAISDPVERASLEEGLVGRYHEELQKRGVSGYSWEQCWRDYRYRAFGTLVMAIASSMLVERTDRGDQMFLCSVERACAQIDHLDSLELLP